jgi:ATP-dependent metalloprotease FtsH
MLLLLCALGLGTTFAGGFSGLFAGPMGTAIAVLLGILAVLAGLAWWGRRVQKQQGVGNFNEFRKNRSRLLLPNAEKTRFTDVGGNAEAKRVLGDVVTWLRDPRRWDEAKIRAPHGILLEGPPGNGKTLLARAVAGEAGVQFFVASATDFVELFVGVGAARVRDLFETAAKSSPCVIFIDELDAVGRRRGAGVGLNNDEREQTLNQLLVQLDGFDRQGRYVVLAATNRSDVLDPALLRPGRFDVRVRVGEPAEADRREIFDVHTRGRKLEGVSIDALAVATEGWTGAAIERLANEAAMRALRRTPTGPVVTQQADFEAVLQAERDAARHLGPLDLVLIESMSQVAEPTGPAHGEFTLLDGSVVHGTVVWANPELVKLRSAAVPGGWLLSRSQVRSARAVDVPRAPAG